MRPSTPNSCTMDSSNLSATTQQLQELRMLLACLPSSLPEPTAGATKYPFISFRPNPDFLERTEDKLGVVNESLKSAFGWRSCTSGDGIIPIVESGKNICAVADVLKHYLTIHPGDAILLKWVADLSEAARKAGRVGNGVKDR
jgi:hypothetical protein